MTMQNKIDGYLSNQQHSIKGYEILEDEMIYEISQQFSQHIWYGLSSVGIEQVTLENGALVYIVNEEHATELVKQTAPGLKIMDTLTNLRHEKGDQDIIAIFDTEEEARSFVKQEYSFIDVEKEVFSILDDDDK